MNVTIETAILKAAVLHSAIKDVRYYLKAVLLEVVADGVMVVATDGKRLFAGHAAVSTDAVVGSQWLIDPSMIASISAKEKKVCLELTNTHCKMTTATGVITTPLVPGIFPPWRRVIPEVREYGGFVQVPPEHLYAAHKAFVLLGQRQVHVRHLGLHEPVLVTASGIRAVVVIMPSEHVSEGGL